MATDLDQILQINEPILYVKKVIRGRVEYFGYRYEYVSQNLTEIERSMLTCSICDGILREAVADKRKEMTVCLKCSDLTTSVRPLHNLRETVNGLRIKCPSLENCIWTGTMKEVIQHIFECSYMCEECPDKCGIILPRKAIAFHLKLNCDLRRIMCEYCQLVFTAQDKRKHLKMCEYLPVRCPRGCGAEIASKKLSLHREECPLLEVECQLGCEDVKMTQENLFKHKNEFIIQHQDMMNNRIANLEKAMNRILIENEKINRELKDLKFDLMTKVDLEGINWSIPKKEIIEKSQTGNTLRGLIFTIRRYKFMGIARFESLNIDLMLFNLSFYVQRVTGDLDDVLVPITSIHCKAILVNDEDKINSEVKDSYVEFEGKVGSESQCLGRFNNVSVCRDSVLVKLYFEINPVVKLDGFFGKKRSKTLRYTKGKDI